MNLTEFEIAKTDSARIVTQALNFEKPDRLPIFDGFWDEFAQAWRDRYKLNGDADIYDCYWIDLKVPVAQEQFFPSKVGQVGTEGDSELINDGWGRVIRCRKGTYFSETVSNMLSNASDLDKIKFESPMLDSRYSNLIKQAGAERAKGRAVFVKIGGLFIRSSFFRGEVDFLMDLAADESFAKALVGKVGAHLMQIGLESLNRTKTYDGGIWIYDDMCNINSPMFSPQTFERVFLPVYKRMISEFKKAGARWVFLHSDGNLSPLLDLLIEAGIDGINPVEYGAGMDIVKLADRYSGKLRFVGGLCNTHILPSNDPAQIAKHVEAVIEIARNGGVVIGTHSVGPDVSVESYELYRKIVAQKGVFK